MEGSHNDKYSFIGEWYDGQASLVRKFYIFYYPVDDNLEMFQINSRKPFMRRMKVNGVTIDKIFIGCTLNILGRLIKVVDYGCDNTRLKLSNEKEVVFMMIKPVENTIAGKILTHLHSHNLRITRMKKVCLTDDNVIQIYRKLLESHDPSYPFLVEYLTGQMVIGMEVVGKNILENAKKVLGDHDPAVAKPGSIRALYGINRVRNCIHMSSNLEAAQEDLLYFFPPPLSNTMRFRLTPTLSNCTLCVVKPHAVREGKVGAAIECIDQGGFDITALNMLIVEHVNAGEFYEVYQGIVPEYKGMVEELASGPCVAMEIVCKDSSKNSAAEFRKLVGPADPEIARLLRPHTLRAKLGNTKVHNAIHCSDLPEDGLLEVEYFFKILDL